MVIWYNILFAINSLRNNVKWGHVYWYGYLSLEIEIDREFEFECDKINFKEIVAQIKIEPTFHGSVLFIERNILMKMSLMMRTLENL